MHSLEFATTYPRLTAAYCLMMIDNVGAVDMNVTRDPMFQRLIDKVTGEFNNGELTLAEEQAKALDVGPLGTLAELSPGPLSLAFENFCIGEEDEALRALNPDLSAVVGFMFDNLL